MTPADGVSGQDDLEAAPAEVGQVLLHAAHVQSDVGALAQVDGQQLGAVQLQAVHVPATEQVEELERQRLHSHLRDVAALLQVEVGDVGAAEQRHLQHVVRHVAAVQHHGAGQGRADRQQVHL